MREAQRASVKHMVRSAALARRLFPRGGFEGLDTTSLQVLLAVAVEPPPGCTVGDAAARLGLSPSTASAAVGNLGAQGFLLQAADAEDGRRALLAVTPEGLALVEAFVADRMADPSVAELS